MKPAVNPSSDERPVSRQIDDIIEKADDWRGKKLSQLRTVILNADTAIIEEIKWRKPSRPEGVPVWSLNGIICVADVLKNAVRLTFPKGAQIGDPSGIFNQRLNSKTTRAVDYLEADPVNDEPLKQIVLAAAELNLAKTRL